MHRGTTRSRAWRIRNVRVDVHVDAMAMAIMITRPEPEPEPDNDDYSDGNDDGLNVDIPVDACAIRRRQPMSDGHSR